MLGLSLLSLNRDSKESAETMAKLVKTTIREEIFSIGYRLFFGVVIVSVIIFSLSQLASTASLAMSQLENGLAIQLLVFGLSALVGSVGLYHFFHSTSTKTPIIPPTPRTQTSLNLEALAMRFAEGFVNGVQSRVSAQAAQRAREHNPDF